MAETGLPLLLLGECQDGKEKEANMDHRNKTTANAVQTKAIETIAEGRAVLGIELGSTRIKAVLIDEENRPLASGSHAWENRLEEGIWTYHLTDVWEGLQDCYRSLQEEVQNVYGVPIRRLAAMGISGMMHGYLPFDEKGELLTGFRTWRNTSTGEAAGELSALFSYNIPQRWSIAHLYQAILNGEEHVPQIRYLTTLAGYVHWKLTGRKVIGVGEASGMFPIAAGQAESGQAPDYEKRMIAQFEELLAEKGHSYPWTLLEILPQALSAGDEAGCLSEEGARLLDPSGELSAGVPICPPEGDAGTGMTATNSVRVRTGNVSAGTSIFAMLVLEKELKQYYEEIDMVTTPAGDPVAMVHCNNCTSDLNAWVDLFEEVLDLFGTLPERGKLYEKLYRRALDGDLDCGGLLAYNYYSGEPVTGFLEGRPLFVRQPDAAFTLANFMRTHLFTAFGALKVGLDILLKEEGVTIEAMTGHGGLFKTKEVGQSFLAAAINSPVTVMETAGEGGAWGMALLAAYRLFCAAVTNGGKGALKHTLADWLSGNVFAGNEGLTWNPDPEDVAGFERFMEHYRKGLSIEQAATCWK